MAKAVHNCHKDCQGTNIISEGIQETMETTRQEIQFDLGRSTGEKLRKEILQNGLR